MSTFVPTTVHLAVSGHCFLPCVHCDMWKHKTPELPTDAWREILSKLGVFCPGASVQFVGGEPLLRRDLEQLIEHSVECGLVPSTCTNGWFVTRNRARSLAEAGLKYAYVSLDGFRAETVDKTRGKPQSFAHAMSAIERFAEEPTVNVIINVLLHRGNANEIADLLAFARREGHLLMLLTLNQTLGSESEDRRWWETSSLWPRTPEALDAIDRALDVLMHAQREGLVLNTLEQLTAVRGYYRYPGHAPKVPCAAGRTEFSIDPLGLVRLCFYRDEIGSAVDEGVLANLFETGRAGALRKNIASCLDGCRLNVCDLDRLAVISRRS